MLISEPIQSGWLEDYLVSSGEVEMQWRNLAASASLCRSFADYDEFREPFTNQTFFRARQRDEEPSDNDVRVADECVWMKPREVVENEKRTRGWDIARRRSRFVASHGSWQKFWDAKESGQIFYFNMSDKTYHFEPPASWPARSAAQPASVQIIEAGWRKLESRSSVPAEDVNDVEDGWSNLVDDETGATFYKATKESSGEAFKIVRAADGLKSADVQRDAFKACLEHDVLLAQWIEVLFKSSGSIELAWSRALQSAMRESVERAQILYEYESCALVHDANAHIIMAVEASPEKSALLKLPLAIFSKWAEMWRFEAIASSAKSLLACKPPEWKLCEIKEGHFFYHPTSMRGAWERPEEVNDIPEEVEELSMVSSKDAARLLEMSIDDWRAMSSDAKLLKQVGDWKELMYAARESISPFIFYYNCSSEEYQWHKPNEVLWQEEAKFGWCALCSVSEPVCSMGGCWEKRGLTFSNQVFFRQLEGAGECQWERPRTWSSLVDRSDIDPMRIPEDLERLALSADPLRKVGAWVEYIDRETGVTFYRDRANNVCQWEKPICIAEQELGILLWAALRGREAGRRRPNLRILRTAVESNGTWKEEYDYFACFPGLPRIYYTFEDEDRLVCSAQSEFQHVSPEDANKDALAKKRGVDDKVTRHAFLQMIERR